MFDAKSGPTGYILPHWCEPVSDEDSCGHGNLDSWATCIVLRLKDEMKNDQRKTLVARFYDIQPSLLLFLRRLRQIKIMDEVSNNSREMVRRDLGDNLIEIKHSKGGDFWFVVKKELKPASGMKPEIETTEIALAFPMATTNSNLCVSLEDIAAQISGKSSVQQPVFAFLPLRSYGFRFIVQADFDVPSSREDVDKDSAWNQWLRSEISNLFIQAFDDFKHHPRFYGLSSIVQFLHFIPLENEILDFFKPVTRAIRDAIRCKPCIPCRSLPNDSLLQPDAHLRQEAAVESNEHPTIHDANDHRDDNLSDSELKWVFPSQTVVTEDHLIEKFINDEDLSRYLGKSYLHLDVKPFLNPALRRVLGIETLSCRHLIDIGKAIAGEGQGKHSLEEFCRWVAKWLCCVYRCLEHERDCSVETLQEIASLSIFPLSNGEYTKLSRQVFLPLEKTVKGEKNTTKASKKAAEIIHKDLRSLHPMILTSLDDIERCQVRKLLEQLQVKCLTSRDLIEHHIIPSLQSNKKQIVKSSEILCSFIIYIKEQWELDPKICNLEELCTCALLKTNKGFVNPGTEPVHFTVEYGNETNLERDFPSVSWTLLDNTYLGNSAGKAQSDCWEKFFSSLGVAHFIAIERKDVCLNKSELSRSVWSSASEFWPQVTGDGRYIIKDYASSELEKLLSADSSEKELEKLAEILDQKWDEKYAKYANHVPFMMDKQGKETGQTYPSIFLLLKEYSWMPSRYGTTSKKPARRCPKDLFLNNEEIVRLLGDHAWYAKPRLSNPKFLTALGIQTSVEFDTLVQIFMKWVENSQSEDDLESTFETSIEHISNVYSFMESQIENNANKRKNLEDVTKDKPVVFIPEEASHPDSSLRVIQGQFVARKRVYWCDPSNQMEKHSRYLSALTQPRSMLLNYYQPSRELGNFFVKFLKIDENPNLKEYVGLMEAIASQSSMASGPTVDNMMYVYNIVGEKCLTQKEDSDINVRFIKNQLSDLKVFATKEDKWVSLDEKPLFSDDKSLEKLFHVDDYSDPRKSFEEIETTNVQKTREKVHFVKMGLQQKLKKAKYRDEEEEERKKSETRRITRNVRAFFANVCGIRNLSECVSQEIAPELISESYHLQSFLHKWVPYIQRFLFYKQPNRHEYLQDQGMVDALANVRCFKSNTLEVVYHLSTHPLVNVSITKNCVIDKRDTMIIYVTNLNDTKDLITELATFFALPEAVGDLYNFISVIIQQEDESQINYYMLRQELDPLPDDVQVWNVPEPAFISMPEPLQELVPETNDDPYPTDVTSDRQQSVNDVDGEPRGLQSWPPRSSAIPPNEAAGKNPSTEQVLTMWPPPAPPEAYSSPVVANQVTADQGLSDPRAIPPLSNHPNAAEQASGPNAAEQAAGPRERLALETSNVETATALADNVATMVPKAPLCDDVNSSQRLRTRPLAIVNNDEPVELEEIQLDSSIERAALISLASNANAEEVGRWGEDCVFKYLQKKAEESGDFEVIWVNEINESGLPYDIIMKQQAEETIETTFIEVKSTSSPVNNIIQISSQEIQCAFIKKETYHLYLVYNAGNPRDYRVSRLRNLATKLENKAVKLFMYI